MSNAPLRQQVDLAVIGGGPAGLAAAIHARRSGLEVALIEEGPRLGGRVFSHSTEMRSFWQEWDKAFAHGRELVDEAAASGANVLLQSFAWFVDVQGLIAVSTHAETKLLQAKKIVIATGAIERPTPFKGWTLPGVMTIGGAQILMKAHGLVPTGKTWLVGTGPLLLLYANQLLDRGVKIDGIIETSSRLNYPKCAARIFSARHIRADILKGLQWQWKIGRAKIPVYRAIKFIEASAGNDHSLGSIRFMSGNTEYQFEADNIFVHDGIRPNLQLLSPLGLEGVWKEDQEEVLPAVDKYQSTSAERIFVAGDCGGIVGARGAELQGKIAAARAVQSILSESEVTVGEEVRGWSLEVKKLTDGRRFLDRLFPQSPVFERVQEDVIVCRCENVTAKSVEEAAKLSSGPNQVKAFTRCGQGRCQGRTCSPSIYRIFAEAKKVASSDVGRITARFPAKPLLLKELGEMNIGD